MKNVAAGALISVGLLTGACGLGGSPESEPTPEIVQSSGVNPAVDFIATFQDGVDRFREAFGCPTDVEVKFGIIPNDEYVGTPFTGAAISRPGEIIINQTLPELYKAATNPINLGHVAVHQAVAACQIVNKEPFERIKLPDHPESIIGVQGLTLIVDSLSPDGKEHQKIPVIEQGVAEIIASKLAGSLNPSDSPQLAIYEEAIRVLMDKASITEGELVKYIQTNDIYGFTGRVLDKPQPTSEDLINLLALLSSLE